MARGIVKTVAGQQRRKEVARRAAERPPARVQAVKPTLSVIEEVISPEQAALYLEQNQNNRTIREHKVDQYAEDMKSGRWQLNGSTIVFDKKGNLLDGQHRLWACFQSETAFRTLVARDVDPEAFHTIDTGIPRPATDIFGIAGESNVGALTAATRMLWRYNNQSIGKESKETISAQELLAYLEKNPGLRESVERSAHIQNLKRLMTPSGAAFAHFLLTRIAGDAAEDFLTKLGRGDQLGIDHPIFRAREALVNTLGRRARGRSEWAVAIVIKAWNFARRNKKVKVVAWSPTKNEEFPRPIV